MSRPTNTNHADVTYWIKHFISSEDRFQPLTDGALVRHLRHEGIETNNTYVRQCRLQQNIPPAQERRKEISNAKA